MKRIALVAAGLMVGSGVAMAQITIDLTPEVRTEFREYVVKEKVAPATIEQEVRVGVALPGEVVLCRASSSNGIPNTGNSSMSWCAIASTS